MKLNFAVGSLFMPGTARSAAGIGVVVLTATTIATPGFAQAQPATIDAADTAWMIVATGLVLMMTIPGLALFYCGMVRKKNVLATWRPACCAPCCARCCGWRSDIPSCSAAMDR
jgi:hypothetical protein